MLRIIWVWGQHAFLPVLAAVLPPEPPLYLRAHLGPVFPWAAGAYAYWGRAGASFPSCAHLLLNTCCPPADSAGAWERLSNQTVTGGTLGSACGPNLKHPSTTVCRVQGDPLEWLLKTLMLENYSLWQNLINGSFLQQMFFEDEPSTVIGLGTQ